MTQSTSDPAQAEASNKVKDVSRMHTVDDCQSEACHQHQNFAENRIGMLKDCTNRCLDRFGAPASAWLPALTCACHLLNHVASPALGWKPPLQVLHGITVDVSALCQFHFWEPVFHAVDDKCPSESPEEEGHWVGIAENVGDALTYVILTDKTQKITHRSAVRT